MQPSSVILFWFGIICLVIVFALAGITKLRDHNRAREGLIAFGVPELWAGPATQILALAELLIAGLLAHPTTQPAGAVGALCLLVAFTLAIVWQLLRGRRPTCACFGALTQSVISWKSVARNLLLIAVAGALLAVPIVSMAPMSLDVTSLPIILALGWAAMSAAWLLLLTRQNGRLLLRIEQMERSRSAEGQATQGAMPIHPLRVGAGVPPLRLNDARGRPFDLGSLRGTPVLFLFLDAGCSHCRPLLSQLRDAHLADAGTALVVISENASLRHELPAEVTVLVDAGWNTRELFGVRGTPAAVSVDANGALARPAVHGTSSVRAALDGIQVIAQDAHHELAPI